MKLMEPASTKCEISALQPNEVAELSLFLAHGFHLPADVGCFSPEVLRWKYLSRSVSDPPLSLCARAGGKIVGHIGFCPRTFVVHGPSPREVPSTYPIDWLACAEQPSLGLLLLLRGIGSAATVCSIGGTGVAQKMVLALGFELRLPIAIFHKILRPVHRRMASTKQDPLRKTTAAARDLVKSWFQRGQPSRHGVELVHVEAFGPEVEEVLARCPGPQVFTTRSPDLLNYYLRHPGGVFSGWLVRQGGRCVGFALLALVRDGGIVEARIADRFLGSADPILWHEALAALTQQLRKLRADEVFCFAGTPWMAQALRQNGYTAAAETALLVRDRNNRLPRDVPYHLTHLEADHAYLQ